MKAKIKKAVAELKTLAEVATVYLIIFITFVASPVIAVYALVQVALIFIARW